MGRTPIDESPNCKLLWDEEISPRLEAEGCLQTGERVCLPKGQSALPLQHSFRTISVPPDQSRRRRLQRERETKFTGEKKLLQDRPAKLYKDSTRSF